MQKSKIKDFDFKKAAKHQVAKEAFTIPELYTAVGIIALVAMLTVTLSIRRFQEQYYQTLYKQAYSNASQAWNLALQENQLNGRTSWKDAQAKVDNFNAFASYFKISKYCNNSNNYKCWYADGEKLFQSLPNKSAYAFVDNSKMVWSLASNDQTFGSDILVDTNGFKGPNKYGQDRFVFWPVTMDGSAITAGLPVKIRPLKDFLFTDKNYCPSGDAHPCYYYSWLYGEQTQKQR